VQGCAGSSRQGSPDAEQHRQQQDFEGAAGSPETPARSSKTARLLRQPQHLVLLYIFEGLRRSALPDEVKADIASCRPAAEHMSNHKHLCAAARKVWLVLEACDLLTDLGSISASSLAAACAPQFRGLAGRCMERVQGQQQLQQWKTLVVKLVLL